MPDLKLVKKAEPVWFPNGEENKSIAVIGYALFGVIELLVGIGIGWLVWG